MLDKHNLSPPLTDVYLPTPGLPTDFGSVKDRAFSRTTKVPLKCPPCFALAKPRRAFPDDRVQREREPSTTGRLMRSNETRLNWKEQRDCWMRQMRKMKVCKERMWRSVTLANAPLPSEAVTIIYRIKWFLKWILCFAENVLSYNLLITLKIPCEERYLLGATMGLSISITFLSI